MSEILYPFGPTIYKGVMSDELQKFLVKSADLSRRKGKSMNDKLAGNIKDQIEGSFNVKKFSRLMRSHMVSYVEHSYTRLNYYSLDKDPILETIDFDEVEFDFGERTPWFNFMKRTEFNPLHNHSGFISAVLMIDVPEVIEEENQNVTDNNMPCKGQIEWVFQNEGGISFCGSYKAIPKTGDIYLFPADLKHQVYPFYSDVERVTMSFNIYELRHRDKYQRGITTDKKMSNYVSNVK